MLAAFSRDRFNIINGRRENNRWLVNLTEGMSYGFYECCKLCIVSTRRGGSNNLRDLTGRRCFLLRSIIAIISAFPLS